MRGELRAGERIPERILCERFGISRTPLREALKVLATEGLIDLLPNRGAVVSAINTADLGAAFEVMADLEALAGELACARISSSDLRTISSVHDQMVRCHRRGDINGYFRLNQAIHERILIAAANPVLTDIYQKLQSRVLRARFAANLSDGRWQEAVREHEEILDALKARDARRLRRTMKRHLMAKFEAIMAVLEEAAPQKPEDRA